MHTSRRIELHDGFAKVTITFADGSTFTSEGATLSGNAFDSLTATPARAAVIPPAFPYGWRCGCGEEDSSLQQLEAHVRFHIERERDANAHAYSLHEFPLAITPLA